ncbi:MAG: hypothetical protein U5R48_09035 [Gammaproteobacteria bacterium]|nr:hypothetical protein [Gammaproteobacteria bacterium]
MTRRRCDGRASPAGTGPLTTARPLLSWHAHEHPAPSSLHEERLDERWRAGGARRSGCARIVDLGCGTSAARAASAVLDSRYSRIHGLEQCGMSLRHAREMLAEVAPDDARLTLQQGSWLDPGLGLTGFDGAVMVETIEHVDPGRLSGLQRAIFETLRPDWLLVTTPNAELQSAVRSGTGRVPRSGPPVRVASRPGSASGRPRWLAGPATGCASVASARPIRSWGRRRRSRPSRASGTMLVGAAEEAVAKRSHLLPA